jgi:hypothetical protein
VEHRAVVPGHGRADLDPGRQADGPPEVVERAADGGEVGRRRREVAPRFGPGRVVAAGHRRQRGLDMVGVGVGQRADDRDLPHEPGRPRQQFAEGDPRQAVAIAPNSPRAGDGPKGLGSQVSCCAGPPWR